MHVTKARGMTSSETNNTHDKWCSSLNDFNTPVNEFQKLPTTPETHSNIDTSANSAERKTRLSKYLWVELVEKIRVNGSLRRLLFEHLELLSVSEETFRRIKLPPDDFHALVQHYGNQNCIRALSVIEDLTDLKKNQYKFMYEKLTLASAIDILIKESSFLYKSLQKHKTARKHFLRLANSWIDYLFIVHKVPEDAKEPLAFNIIQQIELTNDVNLL